MAEETVTLQGSERDEPPGTYLGAADPRAEIEISLYLKDATPGPVTREGLRQSRSARLAPVLLALRGFAKSYGLSITSEEPARRLVKLKGELGAMEQAFQTSLEHYQHLGITYRGRRGFLAIPKSLADKIESVLGLDTRPAATSKIAFPRTPASAVGYRPNQIADLYAFPDASSGTSTRIGLIELGGGFLASDTAAAFAAMGLPVPDVIAVPVSGGANAPGGDADGEVALDIQVAGRAAPGSSIAVYFAPNTDQGFVDAITQAAHDTINRISTLSISWGSAENSWTGQAVASMNSALSDAAQLGITVTVASGDGLATDGVSDGQAHVDFPASSPFALACGGTHITVGGATLKSETVWNSDGGGSGGGISALFALPDYQKSADVGNAVSTPKPGRGVPDVASDADPNTGYSVVINGESQIIGGTSAAAPLWAAFFARVCQLRGQGAGQPHAKLYANPSAFHDITQGNNKVGAIGYDARPGWDACTGLGTPSGAVLAKVFIDSADS